MNTIERSIRTQLSEADFTTVFHITNGLNYYKSLAERMSWFNSGFEYKEFITLFIDFRDFYNEAHSDKHEVYLYHIASFIKSFKGVLKNYLVCFRDNDLMFRDFLIESIVSLALILTELVNEEKVNV